MTAARPLILLVDDNPRNLLLARDVLNHHGYRTLEAETAEEGLALAREHHPALVLMDVQLPGMDGVQALQHLRADAATAGIPVAAFTAFAMKDDRERFLAAGFDGYFEKPLDVRAFPAEVDAMLAGTDLEARA
jgi:two-component system cell cycle response regulator DivK